MFMIKFHKKDSDPVYLTGKYNSKKVALKIARQIADNSMIPYIEEDDTFKYDNEDLLIVERVSRLKKNVR